MSVSAAITAENENDFLIHDVSCPSPPTRSCPRSGACATARSVGTSLTRTTWVVVRNEPGPSGRAVTPSNKSANAARMRATPSPHMTPTVEARLCTLPHRLRQHLGVTIVSIGRMAKQFAPRWGPLQGLRSRYPGPSYGVATFGPRASRRVRHAASAIGEPVFAHYDPPFMPWLLRRKRDPYPGAGARCALTSTPSSERPPASYRPLA